MMPGRLGLVTEAASSCAMGIELSQLKVGQNAGQIMFRALTVGFLRSNNVPRACVLYPRLPWVFIGQRLKGPF